MTRAIAHVAQATSAEKGSPAFCRRFRRSLSPSRQHVVSTANLTLVWLNWNVGRVITQDIQQNQKRAGYGDQLLRLWRTS